MQHKEIASFQDSFNSNTNRTTNTPGTSSGLKDSNCPFSSSKVSKTNIVKELLQCRNCKSSRKLCTTHESFEKELVDHAASCFKTFNKDKVIQELNQVFNIDQAIHLKLSTKIRYLSRKFELPEFLLPPILRDLRDPLIDLKTRIHLAQALKYGVRNKLDIGYEDLIELLEGDSTDIKSEILWALGFKVKNSAGELARELLERIDAKITQDLAPEAKAFLKSQIAQHDYTLNDQVWQDSSVILSQNIKRRPQTIVTKNQQVVQSKYQNMESQESKIEFSSIIKALKNQPNKKTIFERVEKLPKEEKESKGSHCLWLNGIYKNAKILYERAKNGLIITDQDKDEYLTKEFLGSHKFCTPGILGDLVTDRMIAAIFNIISRRQKLASGSLEKLVLCLDHSKSFSYYCYLNQYRGSILRHMLDSWCPTNSTDFNSHIFESMQWIRAWKNTQQLEVEKKAEQLFYGEIARIRRDAISAIYNCALRDRNVLNKLDLTRIENCLEDNDQVVRIFAVKILGALVDNHDIHYPRVFETCLRHLEEEIEIQESLDYIYQQSKDPKRCEKLFTWSTVNRLGALLKRSDSDHRFKIDCIEILINYLEHSSTEGLDAKTLENLHWILQDDQEKDKLKEKALILILLAAEKERCLPDSTISSLVENIEYLNERLGSLIIIILGIICDNRYIDISCIEEISLKLQDNRVMIGQGSTITFESSSSENSSSTAISTVAAKIILSCFKKRNDISPEVIDNMIQALENSNNKQTRIFVAKAFSFASDYYDLKGLERNLLMSFEEYTADEIPDVAIYITNAFTKIYSNLLSQEEISISSNHMETLASAYADQELRFDNEDFSLKINKNILAILANQANRQIFSEDTWSILDYIFLSDDSHKKEALDVMKVYTKKKNRIPESTVLAVENVLSNPELGAEALEVLEKVIENGQAVSNRTLKVFVDCLFLNNEQGEGENQSLNVLEIADNNQDFPDNIFEVLELERAGLAVESGTDNFEAELKFLEIETQAGRRLPFHVFKALSKQISNSQVLSILVNVSTNGQLLPGFLIQKMNEIFVPKEKRKQLVQIFFNLAKNNQDIPRDLLEKLERMLTKRAFADQTILIFTYQAQKGEKLSQNIMKNICDKILSTENLPLKQECLSAICSVLQTHGDISQLPIEEILINCLNDENDHIVLASLEGFGFLCSTTHLNHHSIEALVKKAIHPTCSNDFKQRIIQLVCSQSLTDDQEDLLNLVTLNCEKDFQLLNQLSKKGKLLAQNFQEINTIINESFTLQKAVIDMLVLYPNKSDLPGYLIDSIATLMFRTSSRELRRQCLLLIGEVAKSGRVLSEKALSLVCALQDISEVLKLIEKSQVIPKDANLLLQIEAISINDVGPRNLLPLLKEIIAEMDRGFKMTETATKKLLELAEKDKTNLQEFALIFSQAVLQDAHYTQNVKIVQIIEKAIESKKINLTLVQAYGRIIRSQKCGKSLETLDVLVELFFQNTCEEISLEIFSCISDAATSGDFCEKGLRLMEKNIANSDARVRRKCFKGLRAAKKDGYFSEVFEGYCNNLLTSLAACTGTEVTRDLALIETLASVEYLDPMKLKQIPQEDWMRELFLSDLLTRLKANEIEKYRFYKEWLGTEEYLKSQNFDSNKTLKILSETQKLTIENINEILEFLLSKIDLNKANTILLTSLNPFEELKQQWLVSLLTASFNNQQVHKDYINWLAADISSKLATPIISKLFAAISKVDKLTELVSLINFAVEKKIKTSDIYIKDASVCDLRRSLEIKLLGDQIQSSINRYKFATTLDDLFDHVWSFEQLEKLFKRAQHSSAGESLLQVLESLVYYKIPAAFSGKILEILDSKVEGWVKKVNEIAIEINFQANTRVKNRVELISELKNLNSENPSLQNLIEKNLATHLVQIKDPQLTSRIDFKSYAKCPISGWTRAEILTWAQTVKSDPKYFMDSEFLAEALAVIKRANFMCTGFHLTDAQILSSLVQLNADPKQGRLLQVGTGEGKSTIVSVIAIVHALKGKKVDIITSSPVLAERDAKEKAGLYKMFDLSCADNDDKSIYSQGPKSCYKQDIVYGEIAQFQFDTLRDKYSMLGTFAGRECEVAIIDEVDSMLIDDSSNIARLSSTIAGMDILQPFIHLLWQKLNLLQQGLVVVNERNFIFSDQIFKEDVKSMNDIHRMAIEIEGDLEIFIKEQLKNYLQEDLIREGRVTVPNNFKEFVNQQLSKWIENAIRAFMSQEDQQYVIQDGIVKPVAYDSTGIVQSSTSWGDGLHQLIQRKHGLKMTSETCTTNFLSNIGYIRKYGRNLFGLTGTLGSKRAREVLAGVYNVDLVQIPLLHKKQYLELPAVICNDHNQWLEEICDSAIYEANKERGALIICQTIENCKIVAHRLGQKYRAGAIKLYTMNNMNQERDIDKINQGEIIVATNLAGRGTDIKTENIEHNGGLHVIVTFLPPNQRVEDQAFGRTARQGKRGTGQMILNRTMLLEYEDALPKEIKGLRDDLESKMFDEFMEKELPMVTTKDRLFADFCKLLKKIREDLKAKRGFWQKLKNRGPSAYETNMMSALEERWALFLHKIDNEIIPLNESDKEYYWFKDEILEDFAKDKLIKNPYYHIRIANDLLTNSSLSKSQYDQALNQLEKAINLDPKHSAAVFVGKALLEIKTKKTGDRKKKKSQITQELTKALELVSDEMDCLNSLQVVLQQEYPKMECDLSRQLIEKETILGSYFNSIQNALTVIRKSQRLINVTGTKKGSDQGVGKVISHFRDLERDEGTKEVNQEFEEHDKFAVVFHDLTELDEDRDQAIETIKNAPERLQDQSGNKLKNLFNAFQSSSASNSTASSVYKEFEIALNELNYDQVKDLFDSDVQIFDVNQKTALLELEKSNYKSCKKIDLEHVLDGKINQSRKDLKLQDVIKIVKESKNDKEKFNIFFKDANKTALSLQKEILDSPTLSFEYSNLNRETAKNKLQKIKSKSLNLKISGDKTEILNALRNSSASCVQFLVASGNNDRVESVSNFVAIERIGKIKDNEIWIKIENLCADIAETILDFCPSASFQLTFIDVDPLNILVDLQEEELIKISFTKMSSVTAIKLIPILRKASLDFTLGLNNLSAEQLNQVIRNASLDQEDLEITKIRRLSDLYPDNARPNLELAEFAARGIEHIFEINEKRFIPWRSVVTVAAIGSLQIALGGLLISTAFGASCGMGLITEGAADYITAYRAYSRRHFTWSDYAKQKAVSLAISAVSLGAGRLKDGFKGMNTVLSGIEREAIEQAGTQVLVNSQTLKAALIQTGKSLQKLSIHQVAVTTSEVVIREGLNNMAGSLVNFTLEKFKPNISSFIQEKVEKKFSEEQKLRILITKMHALDKIRCSEALTNQINKIAQNVISPERSRNRDMWDSIGMPLCQGIFSDVKLLGSPFGMNLRIMGTLSGLTEIVSMIDKSHSQLLNKLSEIDKESLSIHRLLHQHCKIPLENASEISTILKAKGVIQKDGDCEYIDLQKKNINLVKVSFGKQKKYKDIVVKFCEDVNRYALTNDINRTVKLISDLITDRIIRVTESHLISPWSACAIGQFTNKISANIQNSLIHNQLKNDSYLLSKRFKKKIRRELRNENKLTTISGLINHQAKRHVISYAQCQNIYYAQQPKTSIQKPPSKKVQDYARQIRKSKPASLADMFSLASRFGKEIKIVDSPDDLTEEEKERGVQVILYTKDEKTDKGYYQLVDSNGKIRDVSSRDNDCGFAVFSAILRDQGANISVGELRKELGNRIEQNSENYSKIIEAQDWVKSRYPEEANKILFTGGWNEGLSIRQKEVSMAQREKHQMLLQRKKWKRSFKSIAGTVIKVTVKITQAGEIILKQNEKNGTATNPRLTSIMDAAKIVRITAIGLDMVNEIISSAFENDIFSPQFLMDVLHQIEKNGLTICEAATCLKLRCLEGVSARLEELKIPAKYLRTIHDVIKICQQFKDGKIDLLKVVLGLDKNQIFNKKGLRRYFRDTPGIVKKISTRISQAVKLLQEADADGSIPALASILERSNQARMVANNLGQIYELVDSGLKNGTFSSQFSLNVLTQIAKVDFSKLETPTCIKSTRAEKRFLRFRRLKIPSQQITRIKNMMNAYQKSRQRKTNLLGVIFDCFAQELQDPKILAQIYQLFTKENQDQAHFGKDSDFIKTQKEI